MIDAECVHFLGAPEGQENDVAVGHFILVAHMLQHIATKQDRPKTVHNLTIADTVNGKNVKMPHKAGYRAGIPQKEAYTKWETDKDEIEVDYKQMDDSSQPSWFSGAKGLALKLLLLCTVFLLGLILGYVIRRSVHDLITTPQNCSSNSVNNYQDYSPEISATISHAISAQQIEGYLKNYTRDVHLAGTGENILLQKMLQKQLEDFGLQIHTASYSVLMSYQNWQNSSTVTLLDEDGHQRYQTGYRGPTGDTSYEHPEVQQSFHAFSPSGNVVGDLVYANYGDEDDFAELKKKNVSCDGNIIIMRYGKIFRGVKVRNAEHCGARGVLLYSDPAQVTGQYRTETDLYPHTWFQPSWTTSRGSILFRIEGDPLTPDLPSLDGFYKITPEQADLPTIPTLPISYADAEELMKYMGGFISKNEFHGSLSDPNVTYNLGPGYDEVRQNWKVELDVNMWAETRRITNVVGVIRGNVEPDRYIIVGCHYDAWGFGAVDPGSGTSILTELARVLGQQVQQGWKPRRTIMLIHWDGEEQALMGSYEWVQEHEKELYERVVAYINLDLAVTGSHMLNVEADPMLNDLIFNISKNIDSTEPNMSLYHQWLSNNPDTANNDPSLPYIKPSGSGSDQAPFVFLLGAAVAYPRYFFDASDHGFSSYPGYHTVIDNFEYMKTFIDPEFQAHRGIAQLSGELVLQLATQTKLPFRPHRLALLLQKAYDELGPALNDIPTGERMLEPLKYAVANFSLVVRNFMDKFEYLNMSNVLSVRRYNDKILHLSRAFVHHKGQEGRPSIRNILFAPSAVSSYMGVLTGIHDAIAGWETDRSSAAVQRVHEQISITTLAVQSASRILQEDIFS